MPIRRLLVAMALGSAVVLAQTARAQTYGGIYFPQGPSSFADLVLTYDPQFSGGPGPTNHDYMDPTKALGIPDYSGGFNGSGAVALGLQGLLELEFTDNVVTNSGDSTDDMAVFEVGEPEGFYLALRPANDATRTLLGTACVDVRPPFGDGYCEVGLLSGGTDVVDLDAAFPGFAAGQLRFDAVQMVDQHGNNGAQVGADIDAVGAIQSAPIVCGDGRVEGEETCDDGGTSSGDGCAANCAQEQCYACTGEPSVCVPANGAPCEDGEPCTANDTCSGTTCIGGPPPTCDDGNVCTNDSCLMGVGCQHAPNSHSCDDGSSCSTNDHCSGGACVGDANVLTGCRVSLGQTAPFRVRNKTDDDLDSLVWTWPHGQSTDFSAFGDPISGSGNYELCVFESTPGNPKLRISASVPKGGTCGNRQCWGLKGSQGYIYKYLGAPYGFKSIILKAGDNGQAKIIVKGRGSALKIENLGLAAPVLVQLKDSSTGECWEAGYSDPIQNDDTRFKAKF